VLMMSPTFSQSVCLTARGNVFSMLVYLNDNVAIEGIIDTAATDPVLVCDEVAKALKLPEGTPTHVQTTGGMKAASEVILKSVRAGQIEVHDVAVIVMSQSGPCRLLLGVSFLRRLRSLTLQGN